MEEQSGNKIMSESNYELFYDDDYDFEDDFHIEDYPTEPEEMIVTRSHYNQPAEEIEIYIDKDFDPAENLRKIKCPEVF